jgi:4-amino-4-deoxy-L-arabinose transferase-like glycosyltransferase
MPKLRAVFDRATLAFLVLAALMLWFRVWGLMASPLNLTYDEAQYWAWSQIWDWGYYSKPPLIAWTIAGATHLFGDAEWAVRLASPIGHSIGALALFGLGRSIYGPWQGFWAGVGWLMMPAVWVSSGLMSTDALLLPLWALALFALWRLIATRAWIWAIILGAFIGLGLLAKYAMLYFVLCAFFAAWHSPPARKVLADARGALSLVIALAIWSPNLVWNAQHHFATVAHTASNARFSGEWFNFDELIEFLGAQMGVLGPVLFVLLIGLFFRSARRAAGLSNEDRLLLSFIVPPLAIVTLISFLSRANANWAATAYPAAMVWLSGSLFAWRRGPRLLAGATLINAALGALVAAIGIFPVLADRVPAFANAIKDARGWDETTNAIAARASAAPADSPFTAVLVDDRELFYGLAYYWRDNRERGEALPPVRMWLLHGEPENAAETSDPMRIEEGARVLVVNANPDYVPRVAGDFTAFRHVENISIPVGGGKTRNVSFSIGEGFAPAPRVAGE